MKVMYMVHFILLLTASLAFAGDCDEFMDQIRRNPNSEAGYYNVACCYAKDSNLEEAFYYLEQAVEAGLKNTTWLEKDPDLKALHQDARWKDMVDRVRKRETIYIRGINADLYTMYKEDHADRQTDAANLLERDAQRRQKARQLVTKGALRVSDDYYHAATIFYHGTQPEHFKLSHELAVKATELDTWFHAAKTLACSAQDRWLQSEGKPQIWGTQIKRMGDKFTLDPFNDGAVSDSDRRKWHVPTIKESKARVKELNGEN